MSILSKIKSFFTVKKERRFVVGVFLDDTYNVFTFRKNLLSEVQKSKEICNCKNALFPSGPFSRRFAEELVTRELEKSGICYRDASFNAQHFFKHIDNQILLLKYAYSVKPNLAGVLEMQEAPNIYCSNFGQIDFYFTIHQNGSVTWTMNAKEFGLPENRDETVAQIMQQETFEEAIDKVKQSIGKYIDSIDRSKKGIKSITDLDKEFETNKKVMEDLGEAANLDVVERAITEIDEPKTVIKDKKTTKKISSKKSSSSKKKVVKKNS